MNINNIKAKGINTVKAFTLAVSAFVLLHSSVSLVRADHISSAVMVIEKENSDKLITNVKASYNPVVQQIVVSFNLAKQSNVNIKLMDALGNEVLALYNGSLDEGTNNQIFDTNEKVGTGIYFLRVASGSETVVKRISIK